MIISRAFLQTVIPCQSTTYQDMAVTQCSNISNAPLLTRSVLIALAGLHPWISVY
jgi:hypothetical protein